MCLIITGPSAHVRKTLLNTPNLTESIYGYNADGIGFMYASARNHLRVKKFLPNDLQDFEEAIRRLPNDNREVAVHARYKTHGDINMDNVHPYPVIPGRVAMMHNGVLSHGNAADRTKSDTWHYINDRVRPLLEAYPDAFTNEGVIALIENDIGMNNRFVFMDEHGTMEIYNKDTGIEHDGLWFSNTYAWEPHLLIPGYFKPRYNRTSTVWPSYMGGATSTGKSNTVGSSTTAGRSTGHANSVIGMGTSWRDDLEDYYAGSSTGLHSAAHLFEATDPRSNMTQDEYDALFRGDINDAWQDCDVELMASCLEQRPSFTLRELLTDWKYTDLISELDTPGEVVTELAAMLTDDDIVTLISRCIDKAQHKELAEALLWYGTWEERDDSLTITSNTDDEDGSAFETAYQLAEAALAGV